MRVNAATPVRVEVWSDLICPWCYIGKRRLEAALRDFEGAEAVEVVWRSFQLDPSFARGAREPVRESLVKSKGMSPDQVRAMTDQVTQVAAGDGLTYDLDAAVMVNTIDAHRMTHLAKDAGLGTEMHERLLRAHLSEGRVLDDVDTLVELATDIGLPADRARAVATSRDYQAEVEADISEARKLGVRGVPFFVLNRAYGVSGAQPAEALRSALSKAQETRG